MSELTINFLSSSMQRVLVGLRPKGCSTGELCTVKFYLNGLDQPTVDDVIR